MPPDVSVVIATYNRPVALMSLMIKLLEQTLRPEIIVMDDGSHPDNLPAMLPAGVRHYWHPDTGYHRVERFNSGVALATAPYVILLDDDQLPQSDGFVLSYLRQLDQVSVVRGLGITERGTADIVPWWSTSNLGIRAATWRYLGGLDPEYDGHYGDEDLDFGKKIETTLTPWAWGGTDTACLHTGLPYQGERDGHNHAYYMRKWGL